MKHLRFFRPRLKCSFPSHRSKQCIKSPSFIQMRWHGDHEHDHRDMEVLQKECIRVTNIGIGANLGLAIFKCTAGWFGNSSAMVADGAHSVSDLISDIITLFSLWIVKKDPTHDYPWGYGKFDNFGALTLSSILVFTGLATGANCVMTLSHTCSATPELIAALAAVVSIGVKESLFRVTIKAGEEYKSQTTIANAWHHRSDAYSSVVALVGIGGAMAGMPILDPVAGLVVSGMIIKVGLPIGKRSFFALMDKDTYAHDRDEIKKHIESHFDVQLNRLHIRGAGPYLIGQCHLVFKPGCIKHCEDIRLSVMDHFHWVRYFHVHPGQPDKTDLNTTDLGGECAKFCSVENEDGSITSRPIRGGEEVIR